MAMRELRNLRIVCQILGYIMCSTVAKMSEYRSMTNHPRRFIPTGGSDRFWSDSRRISSECDIFRKKTIGTDRVFIGFLTNGIRLGFRRNLAEHHENLVGSGRIFMAFRQIPTKSEPDSVR